MARDSCSPLNFSVYFLVVGKFSQKKHWQEVNFSPTNSENLAGLTANLESGCGQVRYLLVPVTSFTVHSRHLQGAPKKSPHLT